MGADALALLLKANVAFTLAVLAAAILRTPARKFLGARNAYALWLAPPLAAVAALLPARRISETIFVPAAMNAGPLGVAGTGAPLDVRTTLAWEPVLLAFWAIGAALCLGCMAFRQQRFLKSLEPLEPARHREVQIYRTGRAGVSPALIGALAPRVVVPADFERIYNEEEREWVIAHELTHQRRGDALVNALTALATCLFWFNPIVFFAAARMREDQEMACDAAVLADRDGARLRYAKALVKARLAVEGVALGCAWPARRPNSLLERVEILRRKAPSRRRERAGAVLVGCLAFAGGAAAWSAQPPVVKRTYVAQTAPFSPTATVIATAPAASNVAAEASSARDALPVAAPGETQAGPSPQPGALPEPLTQGKTRPEPKPTASSGSSYIDSLAAVGLKNLSVDQLIAMKIHGVDSEMVRAARAMGFDPTPEDLTAMAVAGVTLNYVEKVRKSGWKDVTIEELVSLRHMNVDPADAAAFAKLGLENLDLDELVSFAALGVTVDYVRALQASGVKPGAADDYSQAAAMGVTPEFIEKARARGFKDLSLEALARLKAADVLD